MKQSGLKSIFLSHYSIHQRNIVNIKQLFSTVKICHSNILFWLSRFADSVTVSYLRKKHIVGRHFYHVVQRRLALPPFTTSQRDRDDIYFLVSHILLTENGN